MPTTQEIKNFILQHFKDFVDNRDPATVERNVSPQYIDHDAQRGPLNLSRAADLANATFARFPDVKVDVRDILVDGDKVVVRNVWSATAADTGKRVEMHGFVLFRMADGKLTERWATITTPREILSEPLEW